MTGVEAAASLFSPSDSTSDVFSAFVGGDEAKDSVDGHVAHMQPGSETAQLFAANGPDGYHSDPYGGYSPWNTSDGAFTELQHAPQEYVQDPNAIHEGYYQPSYATYTDAQWTHAGDTGSLLALIRRACLT